ncbi:Isocitrate dehydrogenase [NADP] [Planctomycetes bacterium Pan216]|uniref:Isocitrate dehydrogenase [NADP] n=1 Tax=Kolteria novifilia TaxID=2527975 RepID=A0A518AYL5_9BACT|nr:Isocitrate dehydrogenase [NADP] [Planctomycetes bacterium Pan216]
MHHVTLIPGDGTGPELCEAARRCIDATGVSIQWDVHQAGSDALQKEGTALPARTLDSIRRNKVALKGPVSTPSGPGVRSVNVTLRQELDLFACLRPCRRYEGVASRYDDADVDLVIIRENTEDLYVGVEFEAGKPVTMELVDQINRFSHRKVRRDTGLSIKPISEARSRRIVRFAFNYARKFGRKRVTAVHKANIMKCTDGLFLQVARELAREFPDIEFEDRIIDNVCMQLVLKPEQFDILVLPNLYGDIISDLAAGIVGGIGIAPSGNIGDKAAVFEPTHGSAPKYKGQNRVNPTALILSSAMMLRHLGEVDAAARLEKAVAAVIAEGVSVTYDLKPSKDQTQAVGTREMVDAIIAHMPS